MNNRHSQTFGLIQKMSVDVFKDSFIANMTLSIVIQIPQYHENKAFVVRKKKFISFFYCSSIPVYLVNFDYFFVSRHYR